MKQTLFAGVADALNSGATEYNGVMGGVSWSGTENARRQMITTPGTISKLYVRLSAAPGSGAGDAYTFTIRKNGNNTTLTVTITQPATFAVDLAHPISVVAGDYITISSAPVNTPDATPYAYWSVEFTGTNARESLIMGHTSSTNVDNIFTGICSAGSAYSTTEDDVRQVCPTKGIIKNLYVYLSSIPGNAGDTYTYTLRKNGVDTALTCACVYNNSTANDTAHSVEVLPGDILTMSVIPSNDPFNNGIRVAFGFTFVAERDGESIVMGGSSDDLNNAANEYIRAIGNFNNLDAWTATETNVIQIGHECKLKKLYVLLSVAPGANKHWDFTIRKSYNPTVLTCEVAGDNTTGYDISHALEVDSSDKISLLAEPTDSPATSDVYWGFVTYREDRSAMFEDYQYIKVGEGISTGERIR